MPLAGHDKDEMIPSADFYLFDAARTPCTPTPASAANGLVINEVLADPPSGLGRDANGDGFRDAADDEFVELVNTGATPICLTGWTLGDVSNPERHVFPIHSLIQPGKALVVFGGGVPTGAFGQSRVQWAAFGSQLSLSNAGDVLTLRDPSGALGVQLSWGDCDGATCAADHIAGSLSIDMSAQRNPERTGSWGGHTDLAATLHSPGVRADGNAF